MNVSGKKDSDREKELTTPKQQIATIPNGQINDANLNNEGNGVTMGCIDDSITSDANEENPAYPVITNITEILDDIVLGANLASFDSTNSCIYEDSKLNVTKNNAVLGNSGSDTDVNKKSLEGCHMIVKDGLVSPFESPIMLNSPPPQHQKNENELNSNAHAVSLNSKPTESSGQDATDAKDKVHNVPNDDISFHLLSLPNDSIHSVASFLSPSDLIALSCANTKSRRVCRTIFRTIRMHGFRCAVEVVSAWIRGAHADARELAALYVKSGVPLYPPCHGHAYHTLTWRMSIEGRAMEARNSPEYSEHGSPETMEGERMELDRFYADRYEARELGGYYVPSLTYVEEKCLFWRSSNYGNLSDHRPVTRNPFLQLNSFQGWTPKQRTPSQTSYTRDSLRAEDIVKVHRHLANQHFSGNPSVEDEANSVEAGPISLSHDFFHPGELKKYSGTAHIEQPYLDVNGNSLQNFPDSLLSSQEIMEHDLNNLGRRDVFLQQSPMYYPFPVQPPILYNLPLPPESSSSQSILSDVTLEIYCGIPITDSSARSKIESFQMKLETLSRDSLSAHFSECLADFWDTFFPLTAGILFFDKHTAVPRMSSLSTFLSKPCPKEIGTVQCEIERIRCYPKNRKSVKGRFFPTYEYRLFIRDRTHNDTHGGTGSNRHDTVIMTARNRGRNFQSSTGCGANNKRGVNNYYLYKATERDSIRHRMSLDGSTLPDDTDELNDFDAPELGRLQSNFIGTEFQIFSPSFTKPSSKFTVESDCETEIEDASSSYHGRTKVMSLKKDIKAPNSEDVCSDDDTEDKEKNRQKKMYPKKDR